MTEGCANFGEYSGCRGFAAGGKIAKISSNSAKDSHFFDSFVTTRTPVIFDTTLPQLKNTKKWDDEYLLKHCRECRIKVEKREDGGSYGKGNEVLTTFGNFLENVKKGHTYLTTQDLEYDEEGRPLILSPPLTELTGDFPLTLDLLSTLVPANVNLWFGHTTDATYSSSGLHHDFHDNLYVLLRGEKKITLISPAEAGNLYMSGKISRVHPNGRINYEGQLQTHADGSDLHADAALQAARRLQAAAERLARRSTRAAERKGRDSDGASSEVVAEAVVAADEDEDEGERESDDEDEDELDRALEEVLDAEIAGEGCDDYEDEEEEEEDWSGASEEDEGEGNGEGGSSEDDDDGSDGAWSSEDSGSEAGGSEDSEGSEGESSGKDQLQKARQLLGPALRTALSRSNSKRPAVVSAEEAGESKDSYKRQRRGDDSSGSSSAQSSSLPANFSRVDTSLPLEQLRAPFPLYAEALERGAAVEVELRAGQMLYIPAGWFHEVRSRSAPADPSCADYYEPGRGGHLALNYWFHPPDGDSFQQPYRSDFWRRDFEERLASLKSGSGIH